MIADEVIATAIATGRFRVDEDGSVWRCIVPTRTGRQASVTPRRADRLDEGTGYRRVRIGRRGLVQAHRMVWMALRGPIPPGMEINHMNLNKADNRIGNLELLTHIENVRHAFDAGAVPARRGGANGQSKLTEADVVDIRRRAFSGEPKRALARAYHVTPTMVRHIVSGRAWAHVAFPETTK